ncbi:MAG TPA: DMT family transporter, partial [Planctomycetota bacterium]|nr:DMT family transporter [Planctomycetota bacterium]
LPRRGLLYMLAASFLFAVMANLVKRLPAGFPVQEIVFFRSLLNVVFTLFLLWRYRAPVLGTHRLSLLARGVFGYAALSFHFYALHQMPVADALVIHNTSPLIVALLAPVWLGERVGARTLAWSAVGLAGVVVVLRPTGAPSLGPGLAALAGATLSSFAYLTIRAIGTREHPLTVVLYLPLVSVLASLGPTAHDHVIPTALEWLVLLGIGLTTVVAQICLTAALQLERASVATSLSYTSVAFAAAIAAVAFGEIPEAGTVLGAGLIACAAIRISAQVRRDV